MTDLDVSSFLKPTIKRQPPSQDSDESDLSDGNNTLEFQEDFLKGLDDPPMEMNPLSGEDEYYGINPARSIDALSVLQNQMRLQEQSEGSDKDDATSLNSDFLSIKDFGSSKANAAQLALFKTQGEKASNWGLMQEVSTLVTIFGVQYINSVEIVYVTPYFLKLDVDDRVDATCWMFPVIVTTLFSPLVEIVSSHINYRTKTQNVMIFFSIIASLMFAFADDFSRYLYPFREDRLVFLTWFGILAFCLIDFSNEMVSMLERKCVEEHGMKQSMENKISFASSGGKMFGFLIGGLQALDVGFSVVMEKNCDLSFILGGVIMGFALILSLICHAPAKRGFTGSLISKFQKLKSRHFFPPWTKVKNSSQKMQLIILSHLFGAANIVMLTVYATAWVGVTVLKGDPDAASFSVKHLIFDVGVSWGSLALLLTSVVILATGYGVNQLLKDPKKPQFKFVHVLAQLLSAMALLSCFYSNDFMDVFIILPLTGFAFETFHSVPAILADLLEIEEKETLRGRYRNLLSFSFFCSQCLMLLIIPCFFLLFPDSDDNLWGMFIAGTSGLLSVFFALFV